MSLVRFRPEAPPNADLAHLVERDLAKVEVAGSSPVIRSIYGLVVQLVRTLACHARGQGFEPPSGRQKPRHQGGAFYSKRRKNGI